MKSKILIIDDSKVDSAILSDIVKDMNYTPIVANSSKKGLEILEKEEVDLILLDIVMKEMSGYEFLENIQPYKQMKYLPVIFVTGLESIEYIVKGLEEGAIDYIKKPFSPAEVKARIKAALRIKALYDELVKLNKKLQDMVIRDSLTGLFNHRHLIYRLAEEFEHARNEKYQSAYLMIDVDNFKKINDTYGHLTGDEVLKKLAEVLQKEVGNRGFVGRYGGEEFAIVLQNVSYDYVVLFARELLDKINHIPISYKTEEKESIFYFSISMGIVLFSCEYKNFMEAVKFADTALYKAKEWGRNKAVIFEGGEFEEL